MEKKRQPFFLLKKGADVNPKDEGGVTPLQWASLSGNIEMASLLIEKGANANAKSNSGIHLSSGLTSVNF